MDQQNSAKLRLEILWWILTTIVVIGILFPILQEVDQYPFLMLNVVFIVVFITFSRYIFLLKHTFLARQQKLKVGLVFLCIPLILYLINGINFFQTFLDEQGVESVLGAVSFEKQSSLAGYIRNEMIFFGVGSLIAAIIMPFRLVLSVWRLRNRGTI